MNNTTYALLLSFSLMAVEITQSSEKSKIVINQGSVMIFTCKLFPETRRKPTNQNRKNTARKKRPLTRRRTRTKHKQLRS